MPGPVVCPGGHFRTHFLKLSVSGETESNSAGQVGELCTVSTFFSLSMSLPWYFGYRDSHVYSVCKLGT